MEKNKALKISLSTFFLIVAIIVICVMGYFLYKAIEGKNTIGATVNQLNERIDLLNNTIDTLEEQNKNKNNNENEKSTNTNITEENTNITTNTTTNIAQNNSAKNEAEVSPDSLKGLYAAELKDGGDSTNNKVLLVLFGNDKFSYSTNPLIDSSVTGHYTVSDNILTLNEEYIHPNDVGGPYPTNGTRYLKINNDGSITDETSFNEGTVILKKTTEEEFYGQN